jgi:hypothetical protein
MSDRCRLILALASALAVLSCNYIVLPPEEDNAAALLDRGWSAMATSVGNSDAGDLQIELTIRNETAAWSAMQAAPEEPAVLTAPDGTTAECDASRVGSGGHRLAPGFQMRGYTAGTRAEPEIRLIVVECAGVEAAAGSSLSIDYTYVTGDYNYYDQQANQVEATLEVALDPVATGLQYPIAEPVEGLIRTPDTEITAINEVVLKLISTGRTGQGLQFAWQTTNPGEYPTYVHIGIPPVIGQDGIVYGLYETPDLASVPITGAGSNAEWTTEVAVPSDVQGLYMLLSVETGKQRYFVHQALDITGG